MSRSKARRAAEWFAKLRENETTQEIEHEDVITVEEEVANIDIDAAAILANITSVDGAGSGLDADTLDGNHASAFALASHTHSGYASSSHSHSYVQSVRLGSRTTVSNTTDTGVHTWLYTSNGYLMAGYQAMWAWGDDMIGGYAQRPVQIEINGSWSTVGTV